MKSVSQTSEHIAVAFDDWLKAEVVQSGEGRNRYLDSFHELRHRITLGHGHDNNWSSQKEIGHQNRLPMWLEEYCKNPVGDDEAEYLSARLLFSPLMFISGAYRVQCYIQANDQGTYLENRAAGSGIDLEVAVSDMLRARLPDGNIAQADVSIEKLSKRAPIVAKLGERAMKSVSARLALGFDMVNKGLNPSSIFMRINITGSVLLQNAFFWQPSYGGVNSKQPPSWSRLV